MFFTANEREIMNVESLHSGAPLVSVVMPAYNAARYISEAIESVISQSFGDWELIIIDDCSSDGTVPAARRYKERDGRISLYSNDTNLGVSMTRRKGVSISSGEWIAFLDADDVWESMKLERQLRFASETGSGFTYTGSSFIDGEGRQYNWRMDVPEKSCYRSLLRQNVISCSSVLIKKSLLPPLFPSEQGIHEDFALWLSILKAGTEARGLNEPLLRYRVTSGSKSGDKLKAAAMTYRTYKAAGVPRLASNVNFALYMLGSLSKYLKLLFIFGKRKNLDE